MWDKIFDFISDKWLAFFDDPGHVALVMSLCVISRGLAGYDLFIEISEKYEMSEKCGMARPVFARVSLFETWEPIICDFSTGILRMYSANPVWYFGRLIIMSLIGGCVIYISYNYNLDFDLNNYVNYSNQNLDFF